MRLFFMLIALVIFIILASDTLRVDKPTKVAAFPPSVEAYHDASGLPIRKVLIHRIESEPFDLVATIIFFLAISHTFFAPAITRRVPILRRRLQTEFAAEKSSRDSPRRLHIRKKLAASLHLVGEVELIFLFWAVPLFLVMFISQGASVTRTYFANTVDYTQPLFVVVIMAIASSQPIVRLAENFLSVLAGTSVTRWWLVILTFGPLLGSLITEPAAMTICAVLLGQQFYRLRPSNQLCYATLGLLFVNVSVGGALTNFAAPAILMIAAPWHWTTWYMIQNLGLRVIPGILICNAIYFFVFKGQLSKLGLSGITQNKKRRLIPLWLTAVQVVFLGWTVVFAREPAFFVGGFVLYLAFIKITEGYQGEMEFRAPIFVGLFLAGLVIHGGLQAWWIEPALRDLSRYPLLLGATLLTAFNDNAAVTYLATLVPDFSEKLKNAIVAGAICGGGLTLIANAPNPAGQSLLGQYFKGGISPWSLFLSSIGPTIIMLIIFAL